jgi:hypothetical protein
MAVLVAPPLPLCSVHFIPMAESGPAVGVTHTESVVMYMNFTQEKGLGKGLRRR